MVSQGKSDPNRELHRGKTPATKWRAAIESNGRSPVKPISTTELLLG
jgi:hypothetical protein